MGVIQTVASKNLLNTEKRWFPGNGSEPNEVLSSLPMMWVHDGPLLIHEERKLILHLKWTWLKTDHIENTIFPTFLWINHYLWMHFYYPPIMCDTYCIEVTNALNPRTEVSDILYICWDSGITNKETLIPTRPNITVLHLTNNTRAYNSYFSLFLGLGMIMDYEPKHPSFSVI